MISSTRRAACRVGSRSRSPTGLVITWTPGTEVYSAIASAMKSCARSTAAMFIAAVLSWR